MTFRETLEAHLQAIRRRDLEALVATLPAEELTLITSDGRLVRSVREFVDMHRGWFESPTWTLETRIDTLFETSGLGLAVIRLDYRDRPAGGPPIHEASYLTLAFARHGGRWVMVHDQNTPIRKPASQE